ncbi:MAG: aldo/keto reductase [SAR324 cluster bacterium]|nr:aldo/keto reductase [SAR324 cluster bacterium]
MLYRRFGKTELQLPVLTLGGMRFVNGWAGPHDVLPDETLQNVHEVAHHALDVGINHFETARDYGKSERAYGKIWSQLKQSTETKSQLRERIIFTTKIAPMPTYEKMRSAIDDSLERLQIDVIDNFDIHGINNEEKYARTFQKNGCLKAVEDAMNEGLIKHLGFSTHGDLALILKLIDSDVFESVNLHYYYFFQRNLPAVLRAAEKDMGVFIISPNDKGGQLFTPPQKLIRLTTPLSPMNFNDRFCLSHPEIHTLSLGADQPKQIDSHLSSLYSDITADAKPNSSFGQIKSRVDWEAAALQRQGKQYCTICYDCLPCPETINIPEVLRFRNMWKAYDMETFATYRYNMLEAHSDWFPGQFAHKCTECGDCLPRCPEQLPIPQFLFETHHRFYKSQKKQ